MANVPSPRPRKTKTAFWKVAGMTTSTMPSWLTSPAVKLSKRRIGRVAPVVKGSIAAADEHSGPSKLIRDQQVRPVIAVHVGGLHRCDAAD